MNQLTKTFNSFLFRLIAILLHAFLNFIFITYLTNFDITGSWLLFIAFVMVVFLLFYVFLRHLFAFISFLKHK